MKITLHNVQVRDPANENEPDGQTVHFPNFMYSPARQTRGFNDRKAEKPTEEFTASITNKMNLKREGKGLLRAKEECSRPSSSFFVKKDK